jgi:predicted DNA binding CopG/RHH family protein
MSKSTGLAAFTARKTASETAPMAPTERKRGKGNVVSMTVRLSRADWERVHQLAVAEGTSIQQLALRGLSKVFAEKGLPSIGS